MKKLILILTVLLGVAFGSEANDLGGNEGKKVAQKHQRWSVKGGKKTIKSFKNLKKKNGIQKSR